MTVARPSSSSAATSISTGWVSSSATRNAFICYRGESGPQAALVGFTATSFDPHNTYELRLRTATATPRSYSLFIDNIRFVNHP